MGNFSTYSPPRSPVVAPPVNRAGETDSRTRRLLRNCVFWPKQAGPGQARRRLVAHPDTRGRVAVAWPPVANLGQ